jgi:hypothetical protein
MKELSKVDRTVAAILAAIWFCGGITGIIVASVYGDWRPVIPAAGALWFSTVWFRVFKLRRRLTWDEIVPWK